jgi:hypothetical protein
MKKTIVFCLLGTLAAFMFPQAKKLTGYAEMMTQLKKLDVTSPLVSLTAIGRSVQGRDIPALFFSSGKFAGQRAKKPLVLIFCQQHGDEPSGKEASLLLAANLLGRGKKILELLDLILVPTLNPDGSELGQRRNAHDRDLNRNHVLLSEPETQALHRLFQQWLPEITLDVHEYGGVSKWWVEQGVIRNADEMLGSLSNLNIDAGLRAFSQEVFYSAMLEKFQQEGYILFPYTVGAPAENERLRFSTNDIDDGRQSLGIYNTLSFILEGKGYGETSNMLERRSAAQFQEVATGERAYVRMDYFPDPRRPSITFPVFDLVKWQAGVRDWKNFEPLVKVKKSVRLPQAYVIPASETALLELLKRHQLRLWRLTAPAEAQLEKYKILHTASRLEEERSMPELDLEKISEKTELAAGDVLIFLNQPARLLIPLLLEPESSWGILTDSGGVPTQFSGYAREDGVYPIMRLMEKADLPLEEIK